MGLLDKFNTEEIMGKIQKAKDDLFSSNSTQTENNGVSAKPKFCSNCGTKLSENEKFCHNCGTKISASDTNSNETSVQAEKPVEQTSSDSVRSQEYPLHEGRQTQSAKGLYREIRHGTMR